MSQMGRFFGCLLLTVCPVVACSVINHFDDVVPAKGSGGEAGSGEGGSSGRITTGGANNGGGIGEAGSGEGGSAPVGPVHGLLAVAGTDPTKGDASVVSLIDPTTGAELARQSLAGATVTGLAYDGAEGKDVWFEFTGVSFPAAPASKAAMQVFSFTDATASWKVVSAQTLPGLPPPRPDTFVVLNDRLSYLSAAGSVLTVLDTSNPKAVAQVKFKALDLGVGNEALGMVGTRGVPGDPTAPGGTLAIVVGSGCNGKQALRSCTDVRLLSVTVGVADNVMQGDASVPFSSAVPVSPLVGEPAFSSAQAGQLGYVAFTTMVGKSVSLKHFDPRDLTKIQSGSPAFKSAWLGGLAYAECQDVALFTGVAQGSLYSASPAGLTAEYSLGYPGQSVVYEPFTQHAITLFNPDNTAFADSGFVSGGEGGAGGAASDSVPALDSFDVTSNAKLTPTAAAKWNPPTNLAPNLAVARFPVAYMCK